MIQQAEIPQRGQDNVVKEGGIRPGEGSLAGFVIEQVGGITWRFLPGFKDFNRETADIHRRSEGGAGAQGADERGAGIKPQVRHLGKAGVQGEQRQGGHSGLSPYGLRPKKDAD